MPTARSVLLCGLILILPTPRAFAGPPDVPPKKYEAAIAAVDAFVAREVAEKKLPALSIALVDDQTIVWSKGYGFVDVDHKTPATAETVYRVGSVSKLFTDIAIMQLVEAGKIDLDAPARKYLPGLAPKSSFGEAPITLRQMMAHRSGLARETPTGSYFDPTPPSLEATVASLNDTELVYQPGTRMKYSNAAISAVGLALEKVDGRPFVEAVAKRVLEPLGMTRSGFAPTPELKKDLAASIMWNYHGREFPAPTFELGISPAGCMYSTVVDLARFMEALFAGGKGSNGSMLKPDTLNEMLKVQFAAPEARGGVGLGFMIGQSRGQRKIGHNGAIYGFATELAAMPDAKLGAVVITSKDCANATTGRIADVALGQMLAARDSRPLPAIASTTPLAPGVAKRRDGHYKAGDRTFDLVEAADRLWFEPSRGGERIELRSMANDLMGDDVLSFGPRLVPDGEKLRMGRETFERVADKLPPAPPAHWLGLIGEYGWDHDVLYILEKDGRLYALIEWFYLDPLTEKSPDVYAFPESGLYEGEKLVFHRDAQGKVIDVTAAGVKFQRRRMDGEDGQTFRITPTRPVEQIRKEIVDAKPPAEAGPFKTPDLVDLTAFVPGIKLDIRYASTNNFLGVPCYTSARALMQRPAAESLAKVQAKLAPLGYGLLIHDAYRPWRVTKLFWEATPTVNHIFVADPSKGSRHNRGCAVDLTLCDLATGKPIEMVGGYDEMSDRSFPNYPGGTSRQRWHRDLLRRMMESEGFTVFEAEWWHFDFNSWREYPILDTPFESLPPVAPAR